MSTRAIAPVVGVSNYTVSKDRKSPVRDLTPKPVPANVKTETGEESGESTEVISSTDEGAISNATPEGKCPVDTTDDDDSSRISDATSDEESDQPTGESDDEPDTFPREYVEKLRDENAKYRQRAAD